MYDFDNDGWRDLFFAPSRISRRSTVSSAARAAQPNRIFRNVAGTPIRGRLRRRRARFSSSRLCTTARPSRISITMAGSTSVVTTLEGPVKLFRNVTQRRGHWLAVRLRGTQEQPRRAWARSVQVTLPDGRTLHGHATTSVGYASSSEPLVRFGLGANGRVSRIEVRWPGGGDSGSRAASRATGSWRSRKRQQ